MSLVSETQTVDPAVTRAKFDREVRCFRDMEASYRRRGILLQDVTFPTVTIAFCAAKMKPAPLLGAVRIDFTDYDLRPPSVRFVDPLTHQEVMAKDCGLMLFRLPKMPGMPREMLLSLAAQGMCRLQPISLVLTNTPEDKPFLCLPGVREYHDNPAHTGDSWLLHRTSGEGSLAFLVENIWKYGPNAMESYLIQTANEEAGLLVQIQAQQIKIAPSMAALVE